MKFKDDVDISNLCPEIKNYLELLDEVTKAAFGVEAIITSGHEGFSGDGVHSNNSLHYKGRAIDIGWPIRIVNVVKLAMFLDSLINIFPDSLFDVLFEINHIHIEYDPH